MPKDLNAKQTGIQRENPVNDQSPTPVRGLNTFGMDQLHPTTHSYGNVDVFDVYNTVRHDSIPVRCGHDIRSYTLASPMLSGVQMHKTYINVPMQAIYPRTWDLQLVPPTQGDDVPDNVRFCPKNLHSTSYDLLLSFRGFTASSDPVVLKSRIRYALRTLFYLESIYSDGSLLARLNYHFSDLFITSRYNTEGKRVSFDSWFDTVIAQLLDMEAFKKAYFDIKMTDESLFKVTLQDIPNGFTSQYRKVTPGALVELLREHDFDFTLDDQYLSEVETQLRKALADDYLVIDVPRDSDGNNIAYNLEYVAAYQLACAQFITDESVDFIFDAKLYRDNLQSILLVGSTLDVTQIVNVPSFEYNGTPILYDVFSAYLFDSRFSGISDLTRSLVSPDSAPIVSYLLDALSFSLGSFQIEVFSARKSLKYGDYFTAARPRPLAVGEVSIPTTGEGTSAVDVTIGISRQRFLNAVNLAGRKVGNYLKGLWGGSLPEAPKDVPHFLASESFGIGTTEVENTGALQASPDAQNTVTAQMRSSNSKYLLEFKTDEPSIVIGLVYFDVRRIYSKTTSRFAFHYDRFDDFIPQMQYIGDQEILSRELNPRAGDGNFAYTLRNMEYKQRYSYASGGVINFLPSWFMITDNEDGNSLPDDGHISPDFIRSTSFEFDRFYKSLTGYSLASRFHFIIKHENMAFATRQMAYTPQILA